MKWAVPCQEPVSRQLYSHNVGVEAVLDERTRVEQKVEALARRELVLLAELGQVACAALERPLAQLAVARVGHRPLKSGSRFSKKALMPSFESSLSVINVNWLCR